MKTINNFFIWFADKAFSEKGNNAICYSGLAVVGAIILFQVVRYIFQIQL